jgi:hypothetical protein
MSVFMPPETIVGIEEKIMLKNESIKMFNELSKQRDRRIYTNIKQKIEQKMTG